MQQTVNEKYGYLTVIGIPYMKIGAKRNRLFVSVQCQCGVVKEVRLDGLKNGHTVSCGCFNKLVSSLQKPRLKHGLHSEPLYPIWKAMKQRCFNKNNKQYHNYGGRGITVCPEWITDFLSFYNWAIANGWQIGLDLDRRNNDGNYEPGNCRFVTQVVNANNKRNNKKYQFDGQWLTIPQIASQSNIKSSTIYRRINELNFSLKDAIGIERYNRSEISKRKKAI